MYARERQHTTHSVKSDNYNGNDHVSSLVDKYVNLVFNIVKKKVTIKDERHKEV